jgi:hypothetical protein
MITCIDAEDENRLDGTANRTDDRTVPEPGRDRDGYETVRRSAVWTTPNGFAVGLYRTQISADGHRGR